VNIQISCWLPINEILHTLSLTGHTHTHTHNPQTLKLSGKIGMVPVYLANEPYFLLIFPASVLFFWVPRTNQILQTFAQLCDQRNGIKLNAR